MCSSDLDVDLIAPAGSIDAGDAGIRVSGNINLAALQVLNVANIQVQGVSAGVPQFNVSLNVAGLQAANNTVAATAAGASGAAGSGQNAATAQEDVPSLVSVEVLGYGGGDGEDQKQRDDDDHKGADSGARDPANG